MPNPFIHCELATRNVPKATKFYAKLFEWKLVAFPGAPTDEPYTIIKVGRGTGGGIMHQMIPRAASDWMPYVRVHDIDAATRKAKKLGAKIMRDVTEVGKMGWLSIITDPTGAILGLFEPKKGM